MNVRVAVRVTFSIGYLKPNWTFFTVYRLKIVYNGFHINRKNCSIFSQFIHLHYKALQNFKNIEESKHQCLSWYCFSINILVRYRYMKLWCNFMFWWLFILKYTQSTICGIVALQCNFHCLFLFSFSCTINLMWNLVTMFTLLKLKPVL